MPFCLRIAVYYFFSLFFAQAQKGFRIEGQIANARPAALILSQHYAGHLIPIDTALIGNDGKFVFQSNEPVPTGMCRVLGIGRGIELFVEENKSFSLVADARDILATIRFVNSPENTLFYDYQREVRRRYEKALNFRKQFGLKDDNDPRWQNRYREFSEEIKGYVDSLYQRQPQLLATRFLKSFQEPKQPVLPVATLSAKDSAFLIGYHRQHYFDHSFLSDERMLYTSSMPARFQKFLKMIPTIPPNDLLPLLEKVIDQTKGTVELRKYVVGQIAQLFELTANKNYDEVYDFVTQKYVLADPTLWDASTLQKVKELQEIKKNLAVGSVFPELIFKDLDNKAQSLAAIKSQYTILFFYDPGCSHCREAAPKLVELSKKYAQNATVYAVSLDNNAQACRSFVQDFGTSSFVNVRDTEGRTEFYKLGVINYPTIYLLDRDKKIKARWLKIEELETYLNDSADTQP
ncbi:MAG: thioredoxin-like domain-containing protein [Runella sp.]